MDRGLQHAPFAADRDRHPPLQDHRAGVDSLVDEVDGDPGLLDAGLERLADRVEPGEARQQGGVDVDDPPREAGDERFGQQLHVAGEDDERGPVGFDPVAHRRVATHPVGVGVGREDGGFDPRPRCPLQRPGARLVGPDPDHLDQPLAVQLVEDRLQVGAATRGEDDDAEGAHARILAQRLAKRIQASSGS